MHETAVPPSDSSGDCSFDLPERVESDLVPADWSCPRESVDGADYCVFHLDAEQRRDRGIDAGTVVESVLEAVGTPGRRAKELAGLRATDLDLSYRTLDGPDNYPIVLDGASIEGTLRLEHTGVGQPLSVAEASLGAAVLAELDQQAPLTLSRTAIEGDLALTERFDAPLRCEDLHVGGDLSAEPAVFDAMVHFDGSAVRGDATFYADFNDEPHLSGVAVDGDVDLFVDINADAYLDDLTVTGTFSLYAGVDGTLRMRDGEFHGPVSWYGRFTSDAHLGGNRFHEQVTATGSDAVVLSSRFYEYVDLSDCRFDAGANFDGVEFQGPVDFSGTRFGADARFDEAVFSGRNRFDGVRFEGRGTFREATFSGRTHLAPAPAGQDAAGLVDLGAATVDQGVLVVPADPEFVYDLTDASVGEVRLRRAEAAGNGDGGGLFDHVRVHETTFEGFDFARHRQELAANDWTVHETVGEGGVAAGPESLETTYMKAKNGATRVDENRAASEFFVTEMRHRRSRHREDASHGASLETRLHGAGRYLANATMGATCGYGEKPWRVFVSSLVTIAVFAGIYSLFGAARGARNTLIESAVLSFETFVALVLGSPPVDSPVINLATSVEAFLGAYFIGLFVFTLTRSVRR